MQRLTSCGCAARVDEQPGPPAVSSIYVLRRTRPDLPRPFRTPGYPVVPAIFLTATALLSIAAFVERPWVSLYSLLSILAGIPVYYLGLQPRRQTAL